MFWLKVFQAICVFSESAAATALVRLQESGRANVSKLLRRGAAAMASAAFLGAAGPAAARDSEYYRRDLTSFMLQCSFDTLAQCQDMSFGRGRCFRNPSLGGAADAYVYAPGVHKTYVYAPDRQK